MHVKGKIIVNFYIYIALGQNVPNSESCFILRLLWEAKIIVNFNIKLFQYTLAKIHNFQKILSNSIPTCSEL